MTSPHLLFRRIPSGLLKRAENNPVRKDNDYDPKRNAGILELVREKSNWSSVPNGISRGASAYICHNSYVAEVVDISIKDNQHVVEAIELIGTKVNPFLKQST